VENAIYCWKPKFGGMAVAEVRSLRHLEQENGPLKKHLSEPEWDKAAIEELVEGNWRRPGSEAGRIEGVNCPQNASQAFSQLLWSDPAHPRRDYEVESTVVRWAAGHLVR